MNLIEFAGLGLMALGLLFFFGTVVGVHRFPDFYTRMHSAAKGDTLSTMLFVAGLLLLTLELHHVEGYIRAAKLVFMILFLFIASPTASHALIQAGFVKGVQPWQQDPEGSNLTPMELTVEEGS